MKTGVTSTKHFASMGFRLDPSLHLSEGLQVREDLAKSPYGLITINDVSEKVFLGNIFSRVFVKDKAHGRTYLAASDTVLANIETGRYLSNKQAEQLKHLWLQKDWILVTCSGTLGNVTYTNSTFEDKIATHDLIRIVPNDKYILKGVVYAFLAGKFGYYQITQSQFGGVVKHTNDKEVGRIVIPKFPDDFQKKVDGLIQESAILREKATEALNQATQMIEDLFPSLTARMFGAIKSSEIISSLGKRFEASFYKSLGKEYNDYIKDNCKWKPLSELANVCRPDLFKRCYVNNGYMFFGGSDIFLSTPQSSKFVSKTRTPNISSLIIKEGTILMPRSGTIGDVAIATSQHAQKLASEDVIRISADNILRAGYLYAFLSSSIGKALIQRYIFGSVIQHVEPHQLNHIPIPIVDDELMNTISSLAISNKEKLGKAGELELKAIALVEQEIEKWN